MWDKNKVSGIDVLEKCPGGAADCNPSRVGTAMPPLPPGVPAPPPVNQDATCSEKGYRYVCDDRTKELYANEFGWKEVALVK